MFPAMRQFWCLFALVALVSVSAAISLEEALHIDGIEAYLHKGVKRQASGTGVAPVSTPANTPTPTPSQPQQKSSAPAPVSTQAVSTPAPASVSSQVPSATPSENDEKSSAAQSTPQSAKVTTPVVRSTPLVSLSVNQFTTVFYTQSNGQDIAITSVGESTAVITTGTALSTELPSTQNGSNGGGGLTPNKSKIIGGVVGGVGGAILLGGLALVAWRVWGRKNHVSEDDADLMAGTGSALGDKHSANASPFQSNLEQYHNPGARPNAAANF